MRAEADVLRGPEDITAAWLQQALGTGPIDDFQIEPIGTGRMSESRRISLDYASGSESGPATIVLKTASAGENSRATGYAWLSSARRARLTPSGYPWPPKGPAP